MNWRESFASVTSVDEIKEKREQFFQDLIKTLNHVEMEHFADEISCIHNACIVRLWEFVKQGNSLQMEWVLFGSGGRREATLFTDQDNGAIFPSFNTNTNSHETLPMYRSLMERMAKQLELAGYAPCSGFVMAVNPRWNGTVEEFFARIDHYLAYPDWDNARFLMIMADMRSLTNHQPNVEQIRTYMLDRIPHAKFLHWLVANHSWSQSIALNVLGNIRYISGGPYRGWFPLKEGLYLPVINMIRLWSLAFGFDAYSSWERSRLLFERGVWDRELYQNVKRTLDLCYNLRIVRQLQIAKEQPTLSFVTDEDLYVDLENPEHTWKDRVQQALLTAKQLQKLTSSHFRKPR
ncbi:DUF294 nucleotidyltransferase-like domain-containing protein [Fodinisporobacter ferrooxydans]|uniref:DUF294 nucleotidyltransferase-like domain-containing protein n=1 Tax=Fodinisporobacter ferrooxydans TaxID=2901836 RepID=A0ABY4CMS1_9BACL|nr:DUF294 nucleotidyltransferase-like domain-containing protein [Alicyclobacillaceae bacterium MYW30-H2]